MTDQDFRALNAELGFPPEAADRLLHDRRADERRANASKPPLVREWSYVIPWEPICTVEYGAPRA